MRHLLAQLVEDETGAIISAEFIIIATIVILALVTGWNAVSATMVAELADIATAMGSLDQSFGYGSINAESLNGSHAHCSGSGYNDSGNTIQITTTANTIAGGGGTTLIPNGPNLIISGGDINVDFNGGGAARANVQGNAVAQAPFAAPNIAVAPNAVPQGTQTEGDIVSEEELEAQPRGIEGSQIIGTRALFDRPITNEENLRVRTKSVAPASVDECEALKAKIRQLCDELQRIDASGAAQPQSLKPTPQTHTAPKAVKPQQSGK